MSHHPHPCRRGRVVLLSLLVAASVVAAACGDDAGRDRRTGATESACWAPSAHEPIAADGVDPAAAVGTTLTLVVYDSFYVPDGTLEAFEAQTGVTVQVLTTADTGTMVSQAVLNAGNPIGDVMWGVDNTFLCRALVNDIFVPYRSPQLSTVDASLDLDPQHRVTPVDYSDLCVNYRPDALADLGLAAPSSLDDLRRPEYAASFVTENPETSAPGMGLLLASIARYGEGQDGWEAFWRDLADGGVAVEPGWTEAYVGRFGPDGDRAMVMSYATSPIYEFLYAETPLDAPPTAALEDACFRSVEFAGILAGTEHGDAAALLVDFLLSPTMQETLPLGMFVFPANGEATVPEEFARLAPRLEAPLSMPPDDIEDGRAAWTERWTEIVLR